MSNEDNSNVQEEKLLAVNLARTKTEKLLNYFHPILVPYYGIKIEAEKIIFRRIKKGAIRAAKGFTDEAFEIPLSEIEGFRKKLFIISFLFNFMMPRYEMKLKSGKIFHLCFFKGQKMMGKWLSGENRKSILEKLTEIKK